MSRPTFTRRPAPELGPDVIRYVVDCRHGTTIGDVIPGGRYVPTDAEVLAVCWRPRCLHIVRHRWARMVRRRSVTMPPTVSGGAAGGRGPAAPRASTP